MDSQKQPATDGTLRTVVIQERRLHVGVHNGWCFLDKPQVVVLEPLTLGAGGQADGTKRSTLVKDRWEDLTHVSMQWGCYCGPHRMVDNSDVRWNPLMGKKFLWGVIFVVFLYLLRRWFFWKFIRFLLCKDSNTCRLILTLVCFTCYQYHGSVGAYLTCDTTPQHQIQEKGTDVKQNYKSTSF